MIAVVVAAPAAAGDPVASETTGRVEQLVGQLGARSFARREAAGRELVALGERALGPLRAAAAASPDPEVQARAQRALDGISARARERELAGWAGSWKTADGAWLKIDGHRWTSGTPTWGPAGGTIWLVEIGPSFVAADMLVEYGPPQGQTCRAIYKLDGNRLRYCGTYLAVRATEFKGVGGYYLADFSREKK